MCAWLVITTDSPSDVLLPAASGCRLVDGQLYSAETELGIDRSEYLIKSPLPDQAVDVVL